MTTVVHCKAAPHDVYIGRPSKWGNPFAIGRDGSREEVIEKYRQHLLSRSDLLESLHELRGKALGCWCSPQACHGDVLAETADAVFVFGSNLAGRHGKGAALVAREHYGAVYGQGLGRHGDSYAIPTKDADLRTLPLSAIEINVIFFLSHARAHPGLKFRLTPIGCGLAGYAPEQIAPMFLYSPGNVILPPEFMRVLTR